MVGRGRCAGGDARGVAVGRDQGGLLAVRVVAVARGYKYTADDQLALETDPDNQQTLTCYDGDGHIAETVPAVGVAANSLTPASCPTS